MSSFAQNLRLLRKKSGMTQREFSELLGINRPAYGSYEESRAVPTLDVLIKMADELDVTLDDLIR